MIKDVKDYISHVGNRLSRAFSMQDFGTEEELEFWALSAEHMSRKEPPSFPDIAKWVDMLYKAPVHLVYRKEKDHLILIRRHFFVHNLLKKTQREAETVKFSVKQKQFIEEFEGQLQNLEKKRQWDDDFLSHGVSSHTIGSCEHIPVYQRDGSIWGIYVVGPFIKAPDEMAPKLSIVGRILSIWLTDLDQEEKKAQRAYEVKIGETVSKLGSGALNTEGISRLLLLYLVHKLKVKSGAVVENRGGKIRLLAEHELSEEMRSALLSGKKPSETNLVISYSSDVSDGFLWVHVDKKRMKEVSDQLAESYSNTFRELLNYREDNNRFTDGLLDTYYKMLRELERSRDKTEYHTPRMIAFAERFGMFFGLEDEEIARLKQTAKLHDIGYVGATGISDTTTVGSELSHPLTGATMLEELPLHKDVIEGVRTHHEWVNGQGSPAGLTYEEIPWTGKIIGVFEYVIDFIESHAHESKEEGDSLLQSLNQNLMERADKQFDMVLIPTVIQLTQTLGWEGCCALGTEEKL